MVMMIGAYLYIVSDESRLEQLSGGLCDARDQREAIRQISTFLTGGFTTPPGKPVSQKRIASRRTVIS
jgi:hypothetical protein